MKTLKNIFKTCLVVMVTVLSIETGQAQPISTHYFGQNAWMPDTVGDFYACATPPCFYNGKLHTQWSNIQASKTSIVRYGGIANDVNMPTNYQYIRVIDSIRAKGMEPVIQVPFWNYRYSASQAADIVHYINVVKGKNIKYWIIANEPDLSYSFNSAAQIAAYFKPFASAMKAVDPNILIIGPEISWFQRPVIDGLTQPGGPYDITGKDAAGRYYLDIISFHSYSFDGSQTRAQVISKLQQSATGLQASLIYLNNKVAAANTHHNRTGTAKLKTAITEANIGWQNPATDNLYDLGANSFVGGQFVAEMLCLGLKHGVDFVNLWSVIEGNSTQTNNGFIDPGTLKKKPLFYHFQMLAQNFKGNYVAATTNQANVKAFASKNSSQTTVIIMNQDQTTNFNYTTRLDNTAIPGASALKINVSSGVGIEYTGVINNQSTTLLKFDASGNLVEKTEYSLAGHAAANLPPTVITTPPVSTGITSNVATSPTELEFKVFPNPTVGRFTIELNAVDELTSYEVQIFNLIGQAIYTEKLAFEGGKEEIELNPSVATGTYLLRIKHGDQLITKKIIVNK